MKTELAIFDKFKILNLLSAILVNILLTSCTGPETFVLNRGGNRLEGLILSNVDSVETRWDNAVLLHNGGIAAVKYIQVTQFSANFTVNILEGDGIKLTVRGVSNQYIDNPITRINEIDTVHPALAFEYTRNGCIIKENGSIKKIIDTIKAEENFPVLIIIKNDGNHVKISVDCDIVYNSTTEIPATEYIILESLSNSKAFISGINFVELLESEQLLFENKEEILLPVDIGR